LPVDGLLSSGNVIELEAYSEVICVLQAQEIYTSESICYKMQKCIVSMEPLITDSSFPQGDWKCKGRHGRVILIGHENLNASKIKLTLPL